MSPQELGRQLSERLGGRFRPGDPTERTRVAAAIQERITTFEAADEYLPQLYPPDPMEWNEEAREVLGTERVEEVLGAVREALASLSGWSGAAAMDAVRGAGKETGARGRSLFMPVRAAVTGATRGPELVDVFEIQGRATTLRVLGQAIEDLETRSGG